MFVRVLTKALLVVIVTVSYVDGTSRTVRATGWTSIRGDGVDSVRACNPQCTVFQGQSVYWLYPEGADWVIGGGPVGYGKLPPETVLHPDGTQETRTIKFMPDLHLNQVKLGWWWPGTKDHPMDERPR